MIVKNLPHFTALGLVFIRLLLDGLAGIKFILEGKPLHTWAIVRAHFGFYARFTQVQRARAKTSKYGFKPLHQLSGTYSGSMVWQFYINKKKRFSDFY